MGNISPVQLIIVLAIVVLIFGTAKLKGMGKDLGGAVKGFKKAMNEEETKPQEEETANLEQKDAEFAETTDKSKDETKS